MSADTAQHEGRRSDATRAVLVALLVLLVLLLAGLLFFVSRVITPVGSVAVRKSLPRGLEWVRSIYGYGPKVEQQFNRPVDAAVGPGGRIWGTDASRARILGFNADGSYATLIHSGPSAAGKGRIKRVEGIATDADGNVYVADFGNEKVLVFNAGGQFLREWPVPLPCDIAVSNGRVVVGSVPGVSVFSLDGKVLSVWGKRGKGPDEFDVAHGVAVAPDGTVYVADTQNRRIKSYDKDGQLLWVWPQGMRTAPKSGIVPTSTPGGLQLPMSITLDGTGRLVIADSFGFDLVVLKVAKSGATLAGRYGEQGSRDGLFTYASGIAYDAERDWFVVADTGNDRLQVVRIPGSGSNGAVAAIRR
ncbi:MAG: NHL repeat-containing protein, partial [Desulfobacterales bacterium]|nr:NHL repeat-containing protein [Desulfobacterales bacterium]